MKELDSNRVAVIREVRRAPARRADNLVSRLYDSARLLRMHATMLRAVRAQVRSTLAGYVAVGVGVPLVFGPAAVATVMAGFWELAPPLGLVGVAGAAAAYVLGQRRLRGLQARFLDGTDFGRGGAAMDAGGVGSGVGSLLGSGGGNNSSLDDIFRREHFRALAEQDDFVLSLWDRARPQVAQAIATFGLLKLPVVSESQLRRLDEIAGDEVTALRRSAGRAFRLLGGADEGESGSSAVPEGSSTSADGKRV